MKAMVLALIASLLAIAQQPAQESSARIEGIVVKAGGDEPLPNALLLLSKDGAGQLADKYGTTTRSDGRFSLKDIPRGRYRLSASMPGFVDQEYGQKRSGGSGAILDLTNEQTLGDITIRLMLGGVISGRVYDQGGHPLEGTVIRAFRRRYRRDGTSSLAVVNFAVTNDLGEYRLYWLPPGTYFLCATVFPTFRAAIGGPGGPSIINRSEDAPEAFAPTFYPNGDDDSQATPIAVDAGRELRGMDFSLTRMKAVKVRGRIVDASSGQPVGGATLDMRPKYLNPADSIATLRAFLLAAHVDDEGKFEFQNAPPGKYTLTARMSMPGFRLLYAQQDLQIGNKDIIDFEIRLRTNPSIRGRLITEGGEPLPHDRTVLIFSNDEDPLNGMLGTFGAGVEPDGTFSLSSVSPTVLHLELTGFPDNFYIRSARTDDADVLTDGLDVTDHSVDSLVVIVGSKSGTVEGVVHGEHQEPIIGAHVVLMPNSGRRPLKVVTTDQSGRFAIRGIAPGDYKIFPWEDVEPNAYFDPTFMEHYESQGQPLHIDESGYVRTSLKAIPAS
jgi:protocatechuate 3,4-dioxygenase beta subunit